MWAIERIAGYPQSQTQFPNTPVKKLRHPEHREAESKDLLRFGKESRTRSFGTRLAARLRMTLWVVFGNDRGCWVALGGDGVGPSASRTFLNILTRVSVNQLHFRIFPQLFGSRQRTVPRPSSPVLRKPSPVLSFITWKIGTFPEQFQGERTRDAPR